jgi:hypothetical protein
MSQAATECFWSLLALDFFAHASINVKIAAMVIDVHQLMKH